MNNPFDTKHTRKDDVDDERDLVDDMENIPNETKNEAFLRLVNKRLPAAVKRIRLLKNLANKSNYEYTDAQAGQVVAVVRMELEELERAFFSAHDEDDVPVIK